MLSAQAQLQRPPAQKSEVLSEQTSLTAVKNLLSVAGVRIKTFHRGMAPDADEIADWIEKGVSDAIEKKYLRSVVFGIYLDPSKPNDLVESYTFSFTYPSSDVHWSFVHTIEKPVGPTAQDKNKGKGKGKQPLRNGKETLEPQSQVQGATKEDMRKATIVLPLPDSRHLTMKLFYYDAITPADYEPPGFAAPPAELEGNFAFGEEPSRIAIGSVETPHHTLSLRIRTTCEDAASEDRVEEVTDSQEALAAPSNGKYTGRDEARVAEEEPGVFGGIRQDVKRYERLEVVEVVEIQETEEATRAPSDEIMGSFEQGIGGGVSPIPTAQASSSPLPSTVSLARDDVSGTGSQIQDSQRRMREGVDEGEAGEDEWGVGAGLSRPRSRFHPAVMTPPDADEGENTQALIRDLERGESATSAVFGGGPSQISDGASQGVGTLTPRASVNERDWDGSQPFTRSSGQRQERDGINGMVERSPDLMDGVSQDGDGERDFEIPDSQVDVTSSRFGGVTGRAKSGPTDDMELDVSPEVYEVQALLAKVSSEPDDVELDEDYNPKASKSSTSGRGRTRAKSGRRGSTSRGKGSGSGARSGSRSGARSGPGEVVERMQGLRVGASGAGRERAKTKQVEAVAKNKNGKLDGGARVIVEEMEVDEEEARSSGVEKTQGRRDTSCVCGNETDDGVMIKCELCKHWAHAACYGFWDAAAIAAEGENHTCVFCSEAIWNLPACADVALIKRAVKICWEEDFSSIKFLSTRLGCNLATGRNIVEELKRAGLIRKKKKVGRRKTFHDSSSLRDTNFNIQYGKMEFYQDESARARIYQAQFVQNEVPEIPKLQLPKQPLPQPTDTRNVADRDRRVAPPSPILSKPRSVLQTSRTPLTDVVSNGPALGVAPMTPPSSKSRKKRVIEEVDADDELASELGQATSTQRHKENNTKENADASPVHFVQPFQGTAKY
ncbi:HORMA domain-containing protein 1 [Gonapodya sp. JEL0774]|nr:HORMA domain-containing protein 1 [Gonapodya sp. JEL0774]